MNQIKTKKNNTNKGENRGKESNSFRGKIRSRQNIRGRDSNRNNKFKPYDKDQKQNKPVTKVETKQAGKSACTTQSNNKISFIADSGATDHIINKGLILKEFVKSSGEEIRSANRNKSANIKTDGRRNLYLKTNKDLKKKKKFYQMSY